MNHIYPQNKEIPLETYTIWYNIERFFIYFIMIEKEGNVDIKGEIWAHDDTEIDNYYSENVCIVKMVCLKTW